MVFIFLKSVLRLIFFFDRSFREYRLILVRRRFLRRVNKEGKVGEDWFRSYLALFYVHIHTS